MATESGIGVVDLEPSEVNPASSATKTDDECAAVVTDDELELSVSFWLTPFCPENREQKFQQSLKASRRTIVLVSCLVLGLTDLRSGLMSCLQHGVLAWETDWPLPTLFWVVNGALHLGLLVLCKKDLWDRFHLIVPTVLAVCVVARFTAYSLAASPMVGRIEEEPSHQIDTAVAVVSAMLCTPMMLALAVMKSEFIMCSLLLLLCSSAIYLDWEWYRVSYLIGATICVSMMCYVTVLHLRQAFVKEEIITQASQREIQSVELRNNARAAAKLAQTRAEAYGDLVAATVHDLRSPLAALASGCRVLRRVFADTEETNTRSNSFDRQPHNEVLGHMDSAISMNQQLLDSMSISAALLRGESISQEAKSVNVTELLVGATAVVTLSKPSSEPVEFEVVVDDEIGNIMTDDLAVTRNLLNLLGNAARHTQRGQIHCSAALDKSDPLQTMIKFAVADTGSGGCTKLDQIWEPFVSHAGSTGLGLYVVRKQTEVLGGVVGVAENLASATGGSIFWFSLPYIPHAGNSKPSTPSSKIHMLNSKSNANPALDTDLNQIRRENSVNNVLLIDDTQFVLESQAQLLRGEGFRVDTALGATVGMQLLQQQQYSLVLCDYNMPGLNGAELAKEFRHWEQTAAQDREFKQVIFALTGHRKEEVEPECLDAGMQGVISKPIDGDCVSQLIQTNSHVARNLLRPATLPDIEHQEVTRKIPDRAHSAHL